MRKYLKDARTKLGLSQNDVAKKLGISPNYYSCIESGDRQSDMKISFLIDLSGILEIPIGKMLAFEKSIERKRKKASDIAKETEEVLEMAKTSKTTVAIDEKSGRALTELARHAAAVKAQLAENIGEEAAESALKYALIRKDQYMAETIRIADGRQIMRVTARPEVNEQFKKDCEKYGAMTLEEVLDMC